MDVPPGVKYTKATEEVNSEAFTFLQSLVKEVRLNDHLSKKTAEVLICGPRLWMAISGVAPTELQSAGTATFVVPNTTTGEVRQFEGRLIKTDPQRIAFWELLQLFLDKYRLIPEHKPVSPITVRKASAVELTYYWSIIPYDSIEEPFFVISIDNLSLLFHFSATDGDVKVFTVELFETPGNQ